MLVRRHKMNMYQNVVAITEVEAMTCSDRSTSVVFMYSTALLSSEKVESEHYNWK